MDTSKISDELWYPSHRDGEIVPYVILKGRLEESDLRTIGLPSSDTQGFRICDIRIKRMVKRGASQECKLGRREVFSLVPYRLREL